MDRKILVAGAAGRMGRAVAAEIIKTPGVTLAGGFDRADSPDLGKDIGRLAGLDAFGLPIEGSPLPGLKRADALIDFTAPAASAAHARAAAEAGVAYVVGTTGFSDAQDQEVAAAAAKIPVVKSGNMSLGVNLLAALVEEAARWLTDDFDIEIYEAHHRAKADAPSGSALMLARAAAKGRGVDFDETTRAARAGHEARRGERRRGDIGFAVVRGGGIVGEHRAIFAGPQETLTLSHSALDRGLFAKGAVAAALWAIGKPAGLYSMRDVLGLSGA